MREGDLFREIPDVGILAVETILFETNCPVVFTCINENKERFVCVQSIMNEKEESHCLITRTTPSIMANFLNNKITMRDLMLQDKEVQISLVEELYTYEELMDLKSGKIEEKEVKIFFNDPWHWEETSIYLPEQNQYWNTESNEYQKEIDYFNSLD